MGRITVLVALCALALVGAFFFGRQVGEENSSALATRLEESEARRDKAEAVFEDAETRRTDAENEARALVTALGRYCSGFDFYFKHDMARGVFRPVRCSSAASVGTVLYAYGFDTSRTQQAWVAEWGQRADEGRMTLIEGGTWAVEVVDPSIVADVRPIVLEGS
ncbi:MAG: hypothetical protein ACRDKF_07350 [Actinomycetota bacterium]